MSSRKRETRGTPCDGVAPYWAPIGSGATPAENEAISEVEGYGGTYIPPRSAQLAPMEHYNTDWNIRPGGPIMIPATPGGWGPPFDPNVPRLYNFSDLPSLPDPRIESARTGLPNPEGVIAWQRRERVRRFTSPYIRIAWSEQERKHYCEIQYCPAVGPDPWEQFISDLEQTGAEMMPIVRGIAIAASYIPVLGTAVSFVINAGIALGEGKSIDSAFFDAVGNALPGQPASGIAFNGVRQMLSGKRVDQALAYSLPIDETLKDAVASGLQVAVSLARGEDITDVALTQLHDHLPEEGQKAMEVAIRLTNGERVVDVLVDEGAQAAANAAAALGEKAVRGFVAEAGFQAALNLLPPLLQNSVRVGLVAGVAEKTQFIGEFGSVAETNVSSNDGLEAKGKKLVASGIRYRGKPVSDILKGSRFTIVISEPNALTGQWSNVAKTYTITDAWKRGFLIAIGLCQGMSARGPGQLAVYQTLAEKGGRDGFDAGQAVQYNRTLHGDTGLAEEATSEKGGGVLAKLGLSAPRFKPAPVVFTKLGPAPFSAASEAKKAADRAMWVAHYKALSRANNGRMSG